MTSQFELVMNEIIQERLRQDQKWGTDRMMSNASWVFIILEELGEVSEAVLKGQLQEVHHELIHVAATAIAWLEDIVAHGNERTDRDFKQG